VSSIVATPSPANLRAFVRRQTRLLPLADLPGIRLHLADDVTTVWHRAGALLGETDASLPYWAFAWSGGLALARYLLDHPEEVAGQRVLDVASGSGLCAIAAVKAGAASVQAIDIDPLSAAAVAINARANGVRIGFTLGDATAISPSAGDVILAGDICYEEGMAARLLDWLRSGASDGARVLLGDPGRTYLPEGLTRLASYRVRSSREIEEAETKDSSVFTIAAPTLGR
jgi:predicted nicotinamide N-methyase